jgi:hypothetical protein
MCMHRMRFRVADLESGEFTDVRRVNAVRTRNISRRLIYEG